MANGDGFVNHESSIEEGVTEVACWTMSCKSCQAAGLNKSQPDSNPDPVVGYEAGGLRHPGHPPRGEAAMDEYEQGPGPCVDPEYEQGPVLDTRAKGKRSIYFGTLRTGWWY